MPVEKEGRQEFAHKHRDKLTERNFKLARAKNPVVAKELIVDARKKLQYSTKTWEQDIYLSLRGALLEYDKWHGTRKENQTETGENRKPGEGDQSLQKEETGVHRATA